MKHIFYSVLFWLCLSATWFAPSLVAQTLPADSTTTPDYYSMSLEELMKLKLEGVSGDLEELINSLISVASQKPQTSRKTPSIITLLTKEEISASGARDLVDVLRLVPGFQFGSDVQNSLGLGVRGNWAQEGKVLVLLDGQEVNEILYGTVSFGNHFDVSQIERIEIIRGPGSAIYGGYAEYGVISIHTQNYSQTKGLQVTGTYGLMKNGYARRNVSLGLGNQWQGVRWNMHLFTGQGQRSDQVYHGFSGAIQRIDTVYQGNEITRIDTIVTSSDFNMAGNSRLDPSSINVGLEWKKLSLRGIYDRYITDTQDGYGVTLSHPYPNNFNSWLVEAKYAWQLTSKISLTPKINFKKQTPWQYTGAAAEFSTYNKTASRLRGNLTMNCDLSRAVNLVAGGEWFTDQAEDKAGPYFYNEQAHLQFTNQALFAQLLLKHPLANFTAGARYDHNSAFGSAFVPRLGLTKKLNKAHFKLLYAASFRAPSIENINLSLTNQIKPEVSRSLELEAGYQLSKSMLLTANLFDLSTRRPIVYDYDPELETELYQNFPRTGSRGLEVEYRLRSSWGFLTFTYAFYSASHKEKVPLYQVPDHADLLLAFPAHQLNLNSGFILGSNWSISPSGSFMSERYGYVGEGILARFKPQALVNVFVNRTHLLTQGLTAGLGVYDLFNQRFAFIQPYNGGHAPLPGPSRELVLRLTYSLNSAER